LLHGNKCHTRQLRNTAHAEKAVLDVCSISCTSVIVTRCYSISKLNYLLAYLLGGQASNRKSDVMFHVTDKAQDGGPSRSRHAMTAVTATDDCRQWLMQRGFLAAQIQCSCGALCTLQTYSRAVDRFLLSKVCSFSLRQVITMQLTRHEY